MGQPGLDRKPVLRWDRGTRVISGALDRDAFDSCIEKVLIPELDPGSVVILDNLKRFVFDVNRFGIHMA